MEQSNLPQTAPEVDTGVAPNVEQDGLQDSAPSTPHHQFCHDVLNNLDLLPKIILGLKGQSPNSALNWKRSVLPIVMVNRHFFTCGTDVTWETIDSFLPLFSLLTRFDFLP